MKYERARKIYRNLPAEVQRDLQLKMIEYFQSVPLFMTLKATKKRNRERRFFITLVGDYLDKSKITPREKPPPQ